MDISVCMIVKNEEEFLKDCLESVRAIASEIIIVDTGSVDKTKEIASEYTEKIYDFKWIDDFSAARNYSVSLASNDWILFLDADERVVKFEKKNTEKLLKKPEYLGVIVREEVYGEKSDIQRSQSRMPRIFNKNNYHFESIIHEQLVRKNGEKKLFFETKILILHYGYNSEMTVNNDKSARNRPLLEKALKSAPNDPYLLYKLGKTYTSGTEKDYKKANDYFAKAIEFERQTNLEYFFDLIFDYGYTLINAGDYEKALSITEYQEQYKSRPDFMFLLAHIYMNNAMFDKAVKLFTQCTSMIGEMTKGVTSYLAYYNIGVIYECLGDKQLAVKNYKSCGDYPPAQARLREL